MKMKCTNVNFLKSFFLLTYRHTFVRWTFSKESSFPKPWKINRRWRFETEKNITLENEGANKSPFFPRKSRSAHKSIPSLPMWVFSWWKSPTIIPLFCLDQRVVIFLAWHVPIKCNNSSTKLVNLAFKKANLICVIVFLSPVKRWSYYTTFKYSVVVSHSTFV